MKARAIVHAAAAERIALGRDPWLLAFAIWLPPLLFIFLLAIFSARLPMDLPVGIVDLDHSQLSRKISRYIDASPRLNVVRQFSSPLEGHAAVRDASIYALIVIPEGLSRDAVLGRTPAVTGFFNGQYVLVAKSVRSTLIEVESTIAVELDVARILVDTPVFREALAKAQPARLQMTPFYNLNMDYGQFLSPGLIVALMQIVICCTTVLVLGRDFKSGRLDGWRKLGTPAVFLGKTLPYTVVFTLQMLLALFMFFFWQDWPRNGPVISMLPVVILFVMACQLLGAFFFVLTFDLARSLSLSGAFTAPAFAFLGVTFPASEMSVFARVWRDLMPASHYMEAYVAQISYGAHAGQSWWLSILLVLYLVLIPWVLYRLRKNLSRHDALLPSAA